MPSQNMPSAGDRGEFERPNEAMRKSVLRKSVLGDQRRLLNLKRWWLVEPGKTAKRWYKARLRSQAKARRQGKDLEPRPDIDDLWQKMFEYESSDDEQSQAPTTCGKKFVMSSTVQTTTPSRGGGPICLVN